MELSVATKENNRASKKKWIILRKTISISFPREIMLKEWQLEFYSRRGVAFFLFFVVYKRK